jgi:hypothetical protein
MHLITVALLLCLVASTGMAEEGLNTKFAFFQGQYRMLGADAGGPVDRMLRLDESAAGLVVSLCDTPDGGTLVPSPPDTGPYLEGRIGSETVLCEPYSSYDNYPLIHCQGEASEARLTLFPANDFSAPLACGN